MESKYYKGDDIIIDLTFKDAAGDPLPPSTLSTYTATLNQSGKGSNEAKAFAFGDFEVIDDAAGEVRLRVDRDESTDFTATKYNLFVLLSFTDASAQGGVRVETIKTTPFEILEK